MPGSEINELFFNKNPPGPRLAETRRYDDHVTDILAGAVCKNTHYGTGRSGYIRQVDTLRYLRNRFIGLQSVNCIS